MPAARRLVPFVAATLAALPLPAVAQAFGVPKGVGSITVSGQYIDNTGHRLSDGFLAKRGQSVTTSALLELDYGVTDRLSATLGLPYVFAKYTGDLPPPSRLPVDACRCWHSSFQDFSLTGRYRLGHDGWAVSPHLTYGRPSHDYAYQGEAVVGRNLQELQVGITGGTRFAFLPRGSLQASYAYSFVEKAVDDVSVDRSNASAHVGYAATRRLFLSASVSWQRTHGGLRFGSSTGQPFPPPGELDTPERLAERDRVLRTNYWRAGGGLSHSLGPVDVFGSFTKYLDGTDTHAGQAYDVGVTWYFGLPK